ncbi:MAG: glutathione S-transferase family protein [Pararhodobacter sp.]
MLVLHYSPASPYVRKVMMVLHESGQVGAVSLAPAGGSPLDPAGMPTGLNPLGKIPALERPDGCTLYDSRVICRFLAEQNSAGAALYPAPPRLWEVLTLEATADGVMDAALAVRYELALRPAAQQMPAWAEGQWTKVTRSLDSIEARWTGHLAGPVTIGQIALGCALGYLDFRFADRPWRAGRPALTDWFARFSARPAMLATAPPDAG